MLSIEIKLNGTVIARATATNVSELADLSDYDVEIRESNSMQAGVSDLFVKQFAVRHHDRRQSVFALVEKIAHRAARYSELLRRG